MPLDTVVYAFNQGAPPEAIVLSYPSLDLADVYAVINYYLYNRSAVDAYPRQIEEIVLLAECSLEGEWDGECQLHSVEVMGRLQRTSHALDRCARQNFQQNDLLGLQAGRFQ